MKKVIFFLFILSGYSGTIYSGHFYLNKKLKKIICDEASKVYWKSGVKLDSCMKSKFQLESKKSIEIEEKFLTTLMTFQFTSNELDFKATLKALLSVSDDGNTERSGWTLSALIPSFNDEQLLKQIWHGSHVVSVDYKNVGAKPLVEKMESYIESDIYEFAGHEDDLEFEIENVEWNVVYHPGNRKLILGYIAEISFASESMDLNQYSSYKFDLQGNFIDLSVEGFGYHE